MTSERQILVSAKFGRSRLMTVARHHDVRREFVFRQLELVVLGATNLIFYALSTVMFAPWVGHAVFAAIALLCITTGEREARRMRACGRFHQCKRSLEVLGI